MDIISCERSEEKTPNRHLGVFLRIFAAFVAAFILEPTTHRFLDEVPTER